MSQIRLNRILATAACLALTVVATAESGARADGGGDSAVDSTYGSSRTKLPPPRGGIDTFTPAAPYTGDFPDPSVMRLGGQYVAFSTNTGAKNPVNLPVMTSPDLITWTARTVDPTTSTNDGLPSTPLWSDYVTTSDGRRQAESWAPSVAKIGDEFALAYAVEVPGRGKCISLGRSGSPVGPFVDSSAGPVVCPPTQNVIDPQIFVDKNKRYLLWKTEGNATAVPKLWIQKMNRSATALAPKGKKKRLLAPKTAWEGGLVENPAMIRFKKTYYLFYSANRWASSAYATGYAVCKGPLGPCKRKPGPLLNNVGPFAGIGGATPFVDTKGQLRLVFHAWTTGQGYSYAAQGAACTKTTPTSCPQRRLHTALLAKKKKKNARLVVNAYDVP